MGFLAALGIGVLALFAVLATMLVRRAVIVRGGAVVMNVRLHTRYRGRGWAPGLGRFAGDDLRWYRIFSLSPRPRHVLSRYQVEVRSRRSPDAAELLALPENSIVLRCGTAAGHLDIAMRQGAINGFLSWLEAAPPGAASRRLTLR